MLTAMQRNQAARVLTILAVTPATIKCLSKTPLTIAPAANMHPSLILLPFRMKTLKPNQTSLPMPTGE